MIGTGKGGRDGGGGLGDKDGEGGKAAYRVKRAGMGGRPMARALEFRRLVKRAIGGGGGKRGGMKE